MMTGLALKVVLWIAARFGVKLSNFAASAITTALFVAAVSGACGTALYKVYSAGFDAANAQWEAKALQSKIDAMKADRDTARRAAADATLKVKAIEDAARKEQEGIAEYVEELSNRPADSKCALTDDDIARLHNNGRRKPNAAKSGLAGKARRFVQPRAKTAP
jgi:hypothetical protein